MNDLIYLFDNIGISTALTVIVIIASVGKMVFDLYDYWTQRLGIRTKKSIEKKQHAEMLELHDVEMREIKSEVYGMSEKISVLGQMIIEMQKKTDVSEQARIKDRISQAYRYYHEKGYWNSMEREAFYDLIRDYENHGGKNSFVHSICEPESYTWKII